MQFQPKVSIVIPAYNAEKTIKACIDSVLALNYPEEKLEIICIDNNSADDTINILNDYSPSVKIFQRKKRGPAATRNKGIKHATGDVIAFTDADCIVDKNWLQNIVQPLQNEQIGIAGGKILATRPCNKVEKYGEIIHDHERAITEFQTPYAITMNWASRLSVLKEVNLFDENLMRSEDSDLSLRIYHAGYKLVYEPGAIIYHRNEKTLSGLLNEGFLHGFYSVEFCKKHKILLKTYKHRRIYLESYFEILSNLFTYIAGKERNYSLCYFIFNAGKKIGRIIGSIRFLHLEL